ncbi:MAG: Transglycosylase SLT domain protein [candidate division CPR1 bacterium ADurb.Bin160]|uniref:Transglycosylase SLT domain protein n=1 Tax=candidate division CPR1 bacterium ADurb.Bin160 TaxID=1852826 RepID=A0A1V5ZJU5_9BACT|nr:MAG: Transglycosylase SLT domain protein [candidate division CPR1 bacterium ADurb.Bin160]
MFKKITWICLLVSFIYVGLDAKIITKRVPRQQVIMKDINEALISHGVRWKQRDINQLTRVLLIGEKEYRIHYRIVLGVMGIESGFNQKACNKITYDFGLMQINKPNWNKLTKKSKKILKKYNIKHSNNKYDVALNVMNGIVHMNDNRNELRRKNKFSMVKWIQSYNCGVRGALTYDYATKRKVNYWNNFVVKFNEI